MAKKFQSTHPHGVRQCPRMVYRWYRVVSIHAPTRGATTAFLCAFKCFMFQSTHPHGVRRCQLLRNNGIVGFQSTHPHGVRLYRIWFIPIRLCVSIHAPTRGATSPGILMTMVPWSFNPRTHTGCDEYNEFLQKQLSEFQSTHPHGVRLACLLACVSIHAPTRGATDRKRRSA